ncbi:tetratricopeptide repeat protein [Kitasatospora griseola]|uniref:tetratricopeptide repeat protein n=1 Tax=Kitasatospora griseola TaxID=2064 RepID=UPI00380AB7E0
MTHHQHHPGRRTGAVSVTGTTVRAVDANDLEYRTRTVSRCIPPELVSQLLAHGHATVVADRARHGEWFCAQAWTRLLAERGGRAEAVEILAPYAATGWWTAVVALAELLEDWGRIDEAIETVRARMALGHPNALEYYAHLLARHGRAAEAFDLLLPHIGTSSIADALVGIAHVAGRDEEAVELLTSRIGAHRCSDFPWCCNGFDTNTALGLLATIRERQGSVDEAIALLARRRFTSSNGHDQLAELLARHNRIDELRTYAAGDGRDAAAERLAQLLGERGDVDGAIAVYRQKSGRAHSALGLARLLARHGRGEEALATLRAQVDAHPGDDWILHTLADQYLAQGRPADGLAHLDAFAILRNGEEAWDLYRLRLPLLAAHLGVDAAITQARSHPEGTTSDAASDLAQLLTTAGRTEEAVAALRMHEGENLRTLAEQLVVLGRVEEALALHQHTEPPQPLVPTTHLWADERHLMQRS